MKTIKKILSVIGLLALIFVVWAVLSDDETMETVKDQEKGIEQDLNQKAGAEHADEYSFIDEDGDKIEIPIPKCIKNDNVDNLTDEREQAIFESIYAYETSGDVYIQPVPDDEQTFREMLRASDAVGTLFNFALNIRANSSVAAYTYGTIIGDYSLEDFIWIDDSYIGNEKNDLMGDEIVSYNAVYAGIYGTTPIFIALDMEVQ